MRHVISLSFCLFALGCSNAAVGEAPFTFQLQEGGKADGDTSLLAADQTERVRAAFEDLVRDGEAEVERIERAIRRYERENRDKEREIRRIGDRIEAREDQLRREHQNRLVVCVLLWSPECVLATSLQNDRELRQLRSDRDAARSEQRRLEDRIDSSRRRASRMRRDLSRVREQKEVVISIFRRGLVNAERSDDQLSWGEDVAAEFSAHEGLVAVQESYRREIEILVDILNNALALRAELTAGIATLERLDQDLELLVESAEKEFMNLLRAAVSGDVDTYARDYLTGVLRSRAKRAIRDFGIESSAFIDFLLDGDEEQLEEDAREELRAELLAAFEGSDTRPTAEFEETDLDLPLSTRFSLDLPIVVGEPDMAVAAFEATIRCAGLDDSLRAQLITPAGNTYGFEATGESGVYRIAVIDGAFDGEPEDFDETHWTFDSGEFSAGEWSFEMQNASFDVEGVLESVSLRLLGPIE